MLVRGGLIELARVERRRGALTHFYRASIFPEIDGDDWETLPVELRRALTLGLLQLTMAEARRAALDGGFDDRETYIARLPMLLDELGVEAVGACLRSAYRPARRSSARTSTRTAPNGVRDRPARLRASVLMGRRYTDVIGELMKAIVGGEYAEGAWLPSETELSARLGASRGVIREALRGLEERGLIAVHPGRGQAIRQRERWDTRHPDVFRALVVRGPDPGVFAEVVDARAVIQREAAARAADIATDADFGLLRARIDEMERALVPGAARRFDASDPLVVAEASFHDTLCQLSGNLALAKLVEPLHLPLAELRRVRAPDRDRTVLLHHRRILEGVSVERGARAGDGQRLRAAAGSLAGPPLVVANPSSTTSRRRRSLAARSSDAVWMPSSSPSTPRSTPATARRVCPSSRSGQRLRWEEAASKPPANAASRLSSATAPSTPRASMRRTDGGRSSQPSSSITDATTAR